MKLPLTFVVAGIVLVSAGCTSSPGRPKSDSDPLAPDQVVAFTILYKQNCAGCHGVSGSGGAAIALNNSVFLAIADDTAIRRTIENGVPYTAMPTFAQNKGGMLTEKQVEAIVQGIRSWAKSDLPGDTTLPPYTSQTPSDAQKGAEIFRTYCSSCHGRDGRGGSKASSVVDSSYLTLVSDQYLRTIVITGRPELGAPDWRGDVEGRTMSNQEISDVLAWLSSQRPRLPSQPSAVSLLARPNGVAQ
jgi:cytochrome c oxidase cbb3-type subunit III